MQKLSFPGKKLCINVFFGDPNLPQSSLSHSAQSKSNRQGEGKGTEKEGKEEEEEVKRVKGGGKEGEGEKGRGKYEGSGGSGHITPLRNTATTHHDYGQVQPSRVVIESLDELRAKHTYPGEHQDGRCNGHQRLDGDGQRHNHHDEHAHVGAHKPVEGAQLLGCVLGERERSLHSVDVQRGHL